MRDTLWFAGVIMVVLFLVVSLQTVMHENAHAEIYENYGCEDVSIQYGPELIGDAVMLGETTASCPTVDADRIQDQQQLVHTIQYFAWPPLILLSVLIALRLSE